MLIMTIRDANGDRQIARGFFGSGPFAGPWPWIQDVIAREFDCPIDAIDEVQNDDGEDFITVRGEIVATARIMCARAP